MATPAQIAANRANSQKSTGPNTLEGRGRAAMNALMHPECGPRSRPNATSGRRNINAGSRTGWRNLTFANGPLEYRLSKTLNLAMELDRGERNCR